MPLFELPDGFRRTLYEQLLTHGWLEVATRGRDKLKVVTAMTAFAAFALATVTTLATSIVDEPGSSHG